MLRSIGEEVDDIPAGRVELKCLVPRARDRENCESDQDRKSAHGWRVAHTFAAGVKLRKIDDELILRG